MATTLQCLNSYAGKSMSDICTNAFTSSEQNHCAHFVSHVHGISFGMLCGDMKFATRKSGASIRCDELYNPLTMKGPWAKKPMVEDGLLIFVLSARNVLGRTMNNVPQKHVGIVYGGRVYNFSNSQQKVVVDSSVIDFHNKFKRSYLGKDISLYFGVAP